jgi:hypothetical protein
MRAAGDEPRIGPNAVIQTMRALAELEDPKVVDTVRRAAALPDPLPEGMIPERWFVMRIVLIHPNYHSGGAEIAGNWPPAWVAYLTGYLKAGGYTDITFVDAMTHHLTTTGARAHRRAQARHRRLHRHHAGHLQGRGLLQIAKDLDEPGRSSPCSAASTAPSCTRRC